MRTRKEKQQTLRSNRVVVRQNASAHHSTKDDLRLFLHYLGCDERNVLVSLCYRVCTESVVCNSIQSLHFFVSFRSFRFVRLFNRKMCVRVIVIVFDDDNMNSNDRFNEMCSSCRRSWWPHSLCWIIYSWCKWKLQLKCELFCDNNDINIFLQFNFFHSFSLFLCARRLHSVLNQFKLKWRHLRSIETIVICHFYRQLSQDEEQKCTNRRNDHSVYIFFE